MILLILRDLQYRQWRVGITIGLMAIVMMLLFIMSGLVNQFNAEPSTATFRSGGDMNWVVAEGTGGPFTSPRPIDAAAFESVRGEPTLVSLGAIDEFRIALVGRSFERLEEPALVEGRYPKRRGEVLIDATSGYTVGEKATVGGLPATIVGLTDDATIFAGVPLAFVTLEFAQQTSAAGQDLLVAKLTNESQVLPAGLKVLTAEDVAADTRVPLEGAIATITLVRALLWLITAIVIAAIIYISALERRRDFAVLKAVGGRTKRLGTSLLAQGVFMTVIAVAVAGVLQSFVAPSFPMTVRVPTSAWFNIFAGAVLAAVFAGSAGVWRVKSTSPVEAFG